jgi:hypothetical protein
LVSSVTVHGDKQTPRFEERRTDAPALTMTGFLNSQVFLDFKNEVSPCSRYLRSTAGERFLRAVAETCRDRLRTIRSGETFWRVQLGHERILDPDHGAPGPRSAPGNADEAIAGSRL